MDVALLNTSIAELRLPYRVAAYLEREGYYTLGQLLNTPPTTLAQINGFGEKYIRIVRRVCRRVVVTGELPDDTKQQKEAPLPEEIRERCEAIREAWPANDPRRRKPPRVETQCVEIILDAKTGRRLE